MSRAEFLVPLILLAALACAPSDTGMIGDDAAAGSDRGSMSSQAPPHADAPHLLTPSGEVVTVEIARTDAQRARGLMFRESLPRNHGMLFLFSESDRHGFWMKNTFLSLDMLWIEADGTIAEIMRGVPPCLSDPCPTYAPDSPGMYVLELEAGEADRLGLREGDQLELRNIETPSRG